MLNVNDLKDQLKASFESIIPSAIETCKKNEQPFKTAEGYKLAEEFAKTFKELVCEDLADSIANAIDYYIKNATITGTIITTGSPFTHMATIMSAPMPVTAGKIPNTLGIN